jgi:hypothetical protein
MLVVGIALAQLPQRVGFFIVPYHLLPWQSQCLGSGCSGRFFGVVFVLGPGFAGVHVGFSFGVSVFAPFL